MSLFGSLFTGVSGLSAQSQATAIISNNIANVNTVGFKAAEASFFSLVTTESRLTKYSPGTVGVNRLQRVSEQGPIQQTASTTDAAIAGNGMFVVKRENEAFQEFLYTRSGQFREDAEGQLRNTAGMVLYGWPIDPETGELPAAQGNLNSLEAVNVDFLGGLTRPTNTGELALNLDANEDNYNPFVQGGSLPAKDNVNSNFSRGMTVYDTLGEAQTIEFEFRKVLGPMANATSGVADIDLNGVITTDFATINDGDEFEITVDGTTETVRIVSGPPASPPVGADVEVQTIGQLLSYINADYQSGTALDAVLDEDGRMVLQAKDPTVDITLTDTIGDAIFGGIGTFNFTDVGSDSTETYSPISLTSTYPDNSPPTPTVDSVMPEIANYTGTHNTQGWWEMTVMHPDGSTRLANGMINFNSDGTLNALTDLNGDIDVQLDNIDWNNGSELQDISIDIERFTQFSGNYNVVFADQDGAELGLRTGVEITREGIVTAQFSNGATMDIYKIPLATFPSVNNLTEVSGTAYKEVDESGQHILREAGEGGAGFLEAANIETSNVDLADEFSKLIVAQRAYSANTKIINTVDQMTEELLRLR